MRLISIMSWPILFAPRAQNQLFASVNSAMWHSSFCQQYHMAQVQRWFTISFANSICSYITGVNGTVGSG